MAQDAADMKPQPRTVLDVFQEDSKTLVEILRNTEQPAPGSTTPIENEALLRVLLSALETGGKLQVASIEEQVRTIHEKLARQTDAILHDPAFQKVEATWRGVRQLVETTDFRSGCRISILDVSKDDLVADLEDNPDVARSGFYRHVYSNGLGSFRGEPIGAVIANYEFGPSTRDIKLLRKCAAVASMAHAPFISAASPTIFDKDWKDFTELPGLGDIKDVFKGAAFAAWRGFREEADARYVGLTLPRYIVRPAWDRESVTGFTYQEDVSQKHEHFLWGNMAFLFAARLTEAFAKHGWCGNIVGPNGGGAVTGMNVHTLLERGVEVIKTPSEVKLPLRRDYELSEAGFIPLIWAEASSEAAFFAAASAKKTKTFRATPAGNEAAANDFLGTQLPYMFMISRLAHYVKRLQVESIGTNKSRATIEEDINDWIGQYRNPIAKNATEMARWPLKEAKVTVTDIDGRPGWYEVDIQVQPHFKYMGAHFTLSLVGKMDNSGQN